MSRGTKSSFRTDERTRPTRAIQRAANAGHDFLQRRPEGVRAKTCGNDHSSAIWVFAPPIKLLRERLNSTSAPSGFHSNSMIVQSAGAALSASSRVSGTEAKAALASVEPSTRASRARPRRMRVRVMADYDASIQPRCVMGARRLNDFPGHSSRTFLDFADVWK